MVNESETRGGMIGRLRRQVARSRRRRTGAPREEMLHEPVLERVEGDEDEAATGSQDALGGAETGGELAELIVDVHAQRLERARGGMAAGDALAAKDAGDEGGELRCAREGLLAAPREDGAGDAAGAALLAEVIEDV